MFFLELRHVHTDETLQPHDELTSMQLIVTTLVCACATLHQIPF